MNLRILATALAAVVLTSIVGCATAPNSSKSSNDLGIRDNCEGWLTSLSGSGSNNPSTARVTLTTILTVGANLAAYNSCQQYGRLTPAPSSTVNDDVYRSTDGSISVKLPEPLAQEGQPGVQVWQGEPSGVQKVYFISTQAGGPVYGVYALRWLFAGFVPKSLSELENKMFHAGAYDQSDIVPKERFQYLYKEDITLADGDPAILEIVRPLDERGSQTAGTGEDAVGQRTMSPYLIYYLIKPKNTKDVYAVLSIFWRGDCPNCMSGPESQIRGMDPRIAAFVNSFRFADVTK